MSQAILNVNRLLNYLPKGFIVLCMFFCDSLNPILETVCFLHLDFHVVHRTGCFVRKAVSMDVRGCCVVFEGVLDEYLLQGWGLAG